MSDRMKLPSRREGNCHKITCGELDGYVITGRYENGELGEIFLKAAKEGSLISGLMDGIAIAVSIGLQHGAPLEIFIEKFEGMIFEPNNPHTGDLSILDVLAKELKAYLPPKEDESVA